jgi:hypothetical protein
LFNPIKLVQEVFVETVKIIIPLFKVLIPMIIVIKILGETGLIELLGKLLAPVMVLVGLPGEIGLAWASALLTNLYGGVIVFATLAKDIDITIAQATVIASMMLMAHGLPVELQITKQAGTRFRAMALYRVGSALIFGIILNVVYKSFNYLQEPVSIVWSPKLVDNTLASWAIGEATNLVWIAAIILALVFIMKVLTILKVIDLINLACKPLLKLMGIGEQAAYTTMIGFTLGLTYGGGLIINEAKSGRLTDRDVFFSLGFMGICHSMIEDTILMMAIGGHLSGILWLRTIFAILLTGLLMRLSASIPEKTFYRHFFVR